MNDGLEAFNVASCTRSTNRCRCHRHRGGSGFLLTRTLGKSVRPVSEPSGTSRETPYTLLHTARWDHKGWKELLLLQRPAKRSDLAAIPRRPVKDYVCQRSSGQAAGKVPGWPVHGHDKFAFPRPGGFSPSTTGQRLGHDGDARTVAPL